MDEEPNVPEWADRVSEPNLISVPISNSLNEIVDTKNNSSKESIKEELIVPSEDSKIDNETHKISEDVKLCPICMSENEKGVSICQVCGYSFK